jgi:hypothetical protein
LLLAILVTGCEQQTGSTPQASSQKVAGMSDFDYLACDGGPHLVLPKEFTANGMAQVLFLRC